MRVPQILFYVLAENGAVLCINSNRAAKNVQLGTNLEAYASGIVPAQELRKQGGTTKLNILSKYR